MMSFQELLCDLRNASFWHHLLLNSAILLDARDAVAVKIVPHKIRLLKPGKRLNSCIQCVELGSTLIMYIDYGADVFIEPGIVENYYLIDIPITGKNHIMVDNAEAVVEPGFISISPVTRPVKYRQEANCTLLTLRVDRQTLEQYFLKQTGLLVHNPIEFQLKTGLHEGNAQSFMRVVTHICEVLQQEKSSLNRPYVADAAEHYLLTTLLHTIPNSYSDLLTDTKTVLETLPLYVTEAKDYILSHLEQNLNLDDLVSITGMSARSLFCAFKKHMGISPMAFAKRERLRQARQELLNNDIRTNSVTDIAIKWGFYNLGYFSTIYAKQYNEKPSETLRQSRAQHRSQIPGYYRDSTSTMVYKT